MVSVVKFTGHSEACANAFKYFMEDCAANPNPFVPSTGIVMGKDWLTETGPNYVAYDEKGQHLGFLAVGWKLSAEKINTEWLVVTDAKILSNNCVARVTVQDGYNIFMYIASSARRGGVGEILLSKMPDILNHGDCRQLRYTAVLDNEGSKALIAKVLASTPELVWDAYAHKYDDCTAITYTIAKDSI